MYGDCGLLHMRLMMRMQGRLAAATAAAAAVVVAASGYSRAASSTAVVDHNVMTR